MEKTAAPGTRLNKMARMSYHQKTIQLHGKPSDSELLATMAFCGKNKHQKKVAKNAVDTSSRI